MQGNLGIVLFWLCARNCAFQDNAEKTRVLAPEFSMNLLDTGLVSSAFVFCLHITCRNKVSSGSFKWFNYLTHTHTHTLLISFEGSTQVTSDGFPSCFFCANCQACLSQMTYFWTLDVSPCGLLAWNVTCFWLF